MKNKKKLVAGVGINDADYQVVKFSKLDGKKKREWICPYYKTWSNMINRCYSLKGESRYSAYKSTTVCNQWLTFSNFKRWMEQQDWEGKELDKDLLTDDNQYSPVKCIFISSRLNSFITGDRGDSELNLTGVYFNNGIYTVNQSGSKRGNSSFTNVFEAIEFYISLRIDALYSLGLDAHLIQTTIKFFERRKNSMKQTVQDNAKQFPTRQEDIQRLNMPSTGDMFKTKSGFWYTVIEVKDNEHIKIQFEDGEEKKVSNARIKTGQIRKKIDKSIDILKQRVDKLYRINSHNLPVGIVRYRSDLFAVSCNGAKRLQYFSNIKDAVLFKRTILVERFNTMCPKEHISRGCIESYFEMLWNEIYLKYC